MKRSAVAPSRLRTLGCDAERQVLEVEFQSGSLYRCEQVPGESVLALLQADSLRRHFNQVFKPRRRLR